VKRIYFIRAEGLDRIKIGWSIDPERRLATLQDLIPFKLVVAASAAGSAAQENYLHALFGAQRVAGEWFVSSARLESLIAEVSESGKLPIWAVAPPGWIVACEDGRGKKISAAHLARYATMTPEQRKATCGKRSRRPA
jgi:hypothetical protein